MPPSPAGLPPRPPRKSTSGSVSRVARKTPKHVTESSPAGSGDGDRYREGSHASRTPRSILQYPIDDCEEEEENETVEASGRTPSSSVLGTPQTMSDSNRSVPVDETETRKPSLGEASVKTMAAVGNLQAAFGLREKSGLSEDDCDDDFASQGRRSIDKCERRKGVDLMEASRAIRDPFYGPRSRAVGRQPEKKMRALAGWLKFATRSRSASRVSPSPKVSSGGKNKGIVNSAYNDMFFCDNGSEVSRNQDLDSLPTKGDINGMEEGSCSVMFGDKPVLDSPSRKRGKVPAIWASEEGASDHAR